MTFSSDYYIINIARPLPVPTPKKCSNINFLSNEGEILTEEEKKAKTEKIAAEILQMSKNKLLVNMRFMDMSLNRINPSPRADLTTCSACDGEIYIYNPVHILTAYRVEENLPIRNFLHSVLHCVFKHFFINTLINKELWDLACDIAVESTINDLKLPFLNILRSGEQVQIFEGFKKEIKTVSAEKIYGYLLEKDLTDQMVKKLSALFKGDDHLLWYMTDEEKAKLKLYGSTAEITAVSSAERMSMLAVSWTDIALRMQTELEAFGRKQGNGAGLLTQNLRELNRERYNYTEFLKKFAVRGEIMKINPEEFDYNFYTYGLKLYDNMPLIEPLEYKDVKRIRDFVIAIDTSGSTSGELVQTFVQKTYNVLKSTESFFTKINLHIIQCDAAIQEDVKITTQQEFDDYLKNMKLHGLGGTDFRPLFSYVNSLVDCDEFENLKGLIYFTDGFGDFPSKKPPYDAAFVFIDNEKGEGFNNYNVPSWAIKMVLRKDEI